MAILYTINGDYDDDGGYGDGGNACYYDNCKQHVADYTMSPLVHLYCLRMCVCDSIHFTVHCFNSLFKVTKYDRGAKKKQTKHSCNRYEKALLGKNKQAC